jgi:hypothetical protein
MFRNADILTTGCMQEGDAVDWDYVRRTGGAGERLLRQR